MKKYSISKPEKYTGKDGQEKTAWKTVGEVVEFTKPDGSVSRILEIPAIGLKANLFEQKPKEAVTPAPQVQEDIMPEVDDDPVNPDDIPF